MDGQWRIELLGSLRARQGDQVVSRFRTQKTAALFAYLAYYRQRPHPRDALTLLLWPEDDLDVGRSKLRQALSSLRRQFEPPGAPAGAFLVTDRATVQLNAAACTTDVAQFELGLRAVPGESTAERALRLAGAVDRYRGELLPGMFEPWVLQERERLSERYLTASGELVQLLETAGDLIRAREYARRAVGVDPLREEAQHDLIRLLIATGELSGALRQYEELERLLAEELGAEPSDETRALLAGIRAASPDEARLERGEPAGRRHSRAVERVALRRPNREGTPHVSPAPVPAPGPDLPRSAPTPHPTGTVTFLALEVVDLTRPPQHEDTPASHGPARMASPSAVSGSPPSGTGGLIDLLTPLLRGHGGHEVVVTRETLCMVFGRATDALAAAIESRQTLERLQWSGASAPVSGPGAATPAPSDAPDRSGVGYRLQHLGYALRAALHTGELEPGEEVQASMGYPRAMRLLVAAHAGQILLSENSAGLIQRRRRPDALLVDLGRYRLQPQYPPERLYEARDPTSSKISSPPEALPEHSGSLPLQLTRFFGREEEMARLVEGVTGGQRLVTLTGPGGSGKTRLALEAAARLRDTFRGAVWYVSLAHISDPWLILDEVLEVLRLPPSPYQEPLEQVAGFLSLQPSLLVLDNLEHLLAATLPSSGPSGKGSMSPDGAATVYSMLQRIESLSLLVTSRQRLAISGETELLIPPLPVPQLPPPDGSPSGASGTAGSEPFSVVGQLLANPSVQLFVNRAQRLRPDFQVTAANAATIARLCTRLEGIPLAIELAAARAGVLKPAQILSRIEQRFELLVSRQRDATPRHRSLRAAIDWSYQLLTPPLRRFFARLSVFRGGWTMEAAAATCGDPGAGVRPAGLLTDQPPMHGPVSTMQPVDVLEYMEQLQQSSLLLADANDTEVRFHLLETLREFGIEQLSPEDQSALAERHAAYYLALAEQSEQGLKGADQRAWLTRLDADLDNLRAALHWMVEEGRAESGLRLAAALQRYWHLRGHWLEGSRWLDRLLELPGAEARTGPRARALIAAAAMAFNRADFASAREFCEAGLAIARECGERRTVAEALNQLGELDGIQFGTKAAYFRHQESLEISRELNDSWGVAAALYNLAYVMVQDGDFRRARTYYEEMIELSRELQDERGLAPALVGLGYLLQHAGDYARARDLFEESLRIQQELDHAWGVVWALNSLARLAWWQGDLRSARGYYERSLAICRAGENRWGVAWVLQRLGDMAGMEGDEDTAIALYEQSLAMDRELANRPGMARGLHQMGLSAMRAGAYERAELLCRESLALRHELGERKGIARCLEGLAELAQRQGAPARAARLLGASVALCEKIGVAVPPLRRPARQQLEEEIRMALGEIGFAAAMAEGRSLSLEEAVSFALLDH